MNKKVKVALIGLGVLAGIGIAQVGLVTAATDTPSEFPRGVQSIVEKFNLNKDEVAKVLEEDKTARQAHMKQKFTENLDAAVASGKITAEQKAAIVAKHDEIRAKRTENRGEMRTIMSEFHTWLESQGIDESIIRPAGAGEGQGMGGRGHRGRF